MHQPDFVGTGKTKWFENQRCVVVRYGVADTDIDVSDPDRYTASALRDCFAVFLQHIENGKIVGSTVVAQSIVDLLVRELEKQREVVVPMLGGQLRRRQLAIGFRGLPRAPAPSVYRSCSSHSRPPSMPDPLETSNCCGRPCCLMSSTHCWAAASASARPVVRMRCKLSSPSGGSSW